MGRLFQYDSGQYASAMASATGLGLLGISIVCALAILVACGCHMRMFDREIAQLKEEREAMEERYQADLANVKFRLSLMEAGLSGPLKR